MVDRVVVNIIQSSEKMSLGFHRPFETVVPNLAAPAIILPVPFEGSTTMKLSDVLPQFLDSLRSYKGVIMIGQYAPRVNSGTEFAKETQDFRFTFGHSFGILAYDESMFITRCRD